MLTNVCYKQKFQETFINKITVAVSRKKTFKLTVDEGWYSEQELKDLGWSSCGPYTWNA